MAQFNLQLPPTNSFVQVDLLNAGSMEAEYHKLHAGAGQIRFRMYNWAFFVRHEKTGRHLLWDLGMAPVSILCVYYSTSSDFISPTQTEIIRTTKSILLLLPTAHG